MVHRPVEQPLELLGKSDVAVSETVGITRTKGHKEVAITAVWAIYLAVRLCGGPATYAHEERIHRTKVNPLSDSSEWLVEVPEHPGDPSPSARAPLDRERAMAR